MHLVNDLKTNLNRDSEKNKVVSHVFNVFGCVWKLDSNLNNGSKYVQ